ncbi:hypothetical protein ACFU5Y_25565 [Streptomyces gardneri]|uniref:hypothetical protein n=1 Tax=Streptomyces gardneri TaxID=66892 RepID=UPI0036B4BCA0
MAGGELGLGALHALFEFVDDLLVGHQGELRAQQFDVRVLIRAWPLPERRAGAGGRGQPRRAIGRAGRARLTGDGGMTDDSVDEGLGPALAERAEGTTRSAVAVWSRSGRGGGP